MLDSHQQHEGCSFLGPPLFSTAMQKKRSPWWSLPAIVLSGVAATGAEAHGLVDTATLLATCTDIRSTGKCHNSYFFTFHVDKVLDGDYREAVFSTGEIYHDFGGRQLLSALEAANIQRRRAKESLEPTENKTVCKHQVVMRLFRERVERGRKDRAAYRLLWVARVGEEQKAQRLEELALGLIGAVEQGDFTKVAPFVDPESGFSEKLLQEIKAFNQREVRFVGTHGFRRIVLHSLMEEHKGKLVIGGGTYDYWFKIDWLADPGRWVIREILKNNQSLSDQVRSPRPPDPR